MSCIFMTGCSTLCQNWLRTLCHEPRSYNWRADKRRSLEEYRTWAEQAWSAEWQSCGGVASGPDYAAGFRDGFVDYVYAGGNGEPPPVPPREFWNTALRSPAGKERVSQWFEGYRHGARVAREGGYRELATVQSSLYDGASYDSSAYPPGMLLPREPSFEEPHPSAEVLPEAANADMAPHADPADRAAERATRIAIIPKSESSDPPSNEEASTDVARSITPVKSVTSPVRFVSTPAVDDTRQDSPAPRKSLPLVRTPPASTAQWRPSLVPLRERASEQIGQQDRDPTKPVRAAPRQPIIRDFADEQS
jgi:hypothetical protein